MDLNTPQDSSQIDTFLPSPDDDSISADSIIPNNETETARDGRLQSLRQLRVKTLSEVESFFTYYEKLLCGDQSRLECSSDVEILLRKLCINSVGFVTPKLMSREIIYKFLDLIPLVLSQSERETALSMWKKGTSGYTISTHHPLFSKICNLVVPITEIDTNTILNDKYDDIFKYQYRALSVVEDIFRLKQDQKKLYTLTGGVLTNPIAFTSISLFNLLRFPVTMFPQTMNNISEASNSVDRVQTFLLAEEQKHLDIHPESTEKGIKLEKVHFTWPSRVVKNASSPTPTESFGLSDISLNIPMNFLAGITGAVGCGKSSLINGILGEMEIVGGNIFLGGKVAYVPQTSYILNDSLRNNILFNSPFNQERYDAVIEACALRPDLDILPAGDQTEIGEKGINLSGGQKVRVSLARAVYQDSDIYILDDPLSAVDAHVSKHIFEKCINGILKGKCVLLVTHALEYLKYCDSIFVMKDGHIVEQGTWNHLIEESPSVSESQSKGVLKELYDAQLSARAQEAKETTPDHTPVSPTPIKIAEKNKINNRGTVASSTEAAPGGKLIQKEDRETGSVGWRIYKQYMNASGGVNWFILLVSMFVLSEAARAFGSYWITFWTKNQFNQDHSFYIWIYVALGVLSIIFLCFRSMTTFFTGIRGSKSLHYSVLDNILHLPMLFFDTTPQGRIINRFSKDIYIVDSQLPNTISSFFNSLMSVLSTVIIISIATPWFLIVLIFLSIYYFYEQKVFITSSREIKRLDNPPSVSPSTSSYLDHHSSIPIGSYNQHDLSLFPEHKQSLGGTSEYSYDNYRGDTSDEEIETYTPKEATAKNFSDSFLPHPLYEEENGRPKSKEPSNESKENHETDNNSHSSLAHSPLAIEYDENDGNTIPHSSQSNRIDDLLFSNLPIHISPPDSRGNGNTPPSYAYTSDDVNYSEIDKDIDSVEIPSKDSNNRGYAEPKKPSKYFPKNSIEYISLSNQSTITPHSPLSPLPTHMNTIKEEKEDIYVLKPFRSTMIIHYVLHSKYRAKSQECCVNHGNDSTHRHNASIPMGEGHKGHLLDIERGLNEIEVDLDTENQLDMDEREKNKNLGEKIAIDKESCVAEGSNIVLGLLVQRLHGSKGFNYFMRSLFLWFLSIIDLYVFVKVVKSGS
ncbi:hypothetical protein WA158_004260 [Blastocystis sp. Blastoise]